MTSLCITCTDIQAALHDLTVASNRQRCVDFELYPNGAGKPGSSNHEWIARRSNTEAPSAFSVPRVPTGLLRIWAFTDSDLLPPREVGQLLHDCPGTLNLALGIGIGPIKGQVLCLSATGSKEGGRALDTLRFVGPRMEHLDWGEPENNEMARVPLRWLLAHGLYSRVVGSIGVQTFSRLQRSRLAIIGAGSLGSQMACGLTRLMSREGHLVLIDPGKLESANLPNWAAACSVAPSQLSDLYKAEALAEHLRTFPDPPTIETLCVNMYDWDAQCALRRSEILICCVDNPVARYGIAYTAALYLRPLLDIGVGVFVNAHLNSSPETKLKIAKGQSPPVANLYPDSGCLPSELLAEGNRTCGADIRLIVPRRTDQSGNCLYCHGGIGDMERIRRELSVPLAARVSPGGEEPFWRERAGSLWMLNSEATGVAQRLLLALLRGDLTGSEHWQMDEAPSGLPQWKRITHRVPDVCPLCRRVGLGDSAREELRQPLDELSEARGALS